MIEMGFRDQLDAYFPETFGNQWDQIINGRSNQRDFFIENEFQEHTISSNSCRKECLQELVCRVILIPFDAVGRTIFSASFLVIKIIELSIRTFILITNFTEENQRSWRCNGCEILDYSLATVLAPFQGSVKAIRLFIAIVCPATFYVSPETLPMRRRMKSELTELVKELNHELKELLDDPNPEPQVIQEASYLLTIKSCLSFATRWGLLDPPESRSLTSNFLFSCGRFYFRRDLSAIYNAMPVDSIKDQYELLQAFARVLQSEKTEESLQAFTQDFKTEKQKQVLERYLTKDFETTWEKAGGDSLSSELKDAFKLLREKLQALEGVSLPEEDAAGE